MGQETEILLVRLRLRCRAIFRQLAALGLIAFALAACQQASTPSETRVDATQYDAFWLWAGVKPQTVLERARHVYILDAELRARGDHRLHILRPQIPQVEDAEIWLVLRVETLNWREEIYDHMLDRLARWDRSNSLAGLQIDFDAKTRGLDGYAEFLGDLRRRLPDRYRLSITGLLDWSANGDPRALSSLVGVVDEILLQTYQGRRTISGYEGYLAQLDGFQIPFRIGLVQGGRWRAPANLEKHPMFRGYAVFLLNP